MVFNIFGFILFVFVCAVACTIITLLVLLSYLSKIEYDNYDNYTDKPSIDKQKIKQIKREINGSDSDDINDLMNKIDLFFSEDHDSKIQLFTFNECIDVFNKKYKWSELKNSRDKNISIIWDVEFGYIIYYIKRYDEVKDEYNTTIIEDISAFKNEYKDIDGYWYFMRSNF